MSSHSLSRLVVFGSLVIASVACSKSDAKTSPAPVEQPKVEAAPAAPAPAPASTARGEARMTFKARCVVCHGDGGKGDGPGAKALNPKPRDYTDATWQASVTDDQIKATIVNGGAAVGKSPIMPASPDLQSKPEVVDELMKIVRGFKG
jgi:mono/diheme cytochrome c family protein